ncbi:UDP-3-O-(3-hydroxymyristoyl)glucosamine N-acyltransferase [Aliarcobacter skirrowii]|uniref:UDP-3-O-acylglucosamine N-acyltransferase n=1 Tax=Aliarcobacter skirrowii TaxID=28200 RepID=A0A2U2C0Q0_9BACT|nr:UDP-3-O-(3-hydroxymyristoyl)glucosamine N-acyltransferase [Aliarcobacter skirrowii]MCT7446696.1 UDP-3-O-(3-hydroxymyristoyl)glucosamine N-acyltransferase [Aliarcobacter skirrowii]MDX3959943.1 UDP-3-O-(3-hydroxymyristoyl)glucosamine N-acyltransferase [Aliarcobacter skirrowii]MDX4012273.1 UDP-3-O-(3-hydroxymyristoyl)glucosamine N-acyltransferase [Aliarcobacter skirrowii]MDX4036865.1 UDP-3-O-(3-hydroxymyristoyl)glucosamine N-acyltransferase [Aliarcobacter skirrowii]MDX4048531.1 UDP-3-O-(3-hydr
MTLKQIANYLQLDCDTDIEITALNSLEDANINELSFLENPKYVEKLKSTKAGAVFVNKELLNEVPKGVVALVCDEPYLNLAKASKLFAPKLFETEGKEPIIGKDTIIMPNVFLGKNSSIGENCTVMAGSFIGDNVQIGNNTIIYPNVTVYRDCKIGSDCIIHSGTVIGSDGFGFANTKDGKYIKIYQNGNVIIGSDVEIGANCTIDRAVFKSTIIEDGVRIDNLVHIAHNCKIGKGSVLVTQVGIAGSTTLQPYVVMGAQSGAAGHLEIAAFSTIAARGGVTKTIKEPKKTWAGFPLIEHRNWLKLQGKISNLLK